jgi:hypothetical protein
MGAAVIIYPSWQFSLFLLLSGLSFFWTVVNTPYPQATGYAIFFIICAILTAYFYNQRDRLLRPDKPLMALYLFMLLIISLGIAVGSSIASIVQNVVFDSAIVLLVWKIGRLIYFNWVKKAE